MAEKSYTLGGPMEPDAPAAQKKPKLPGQTPTGTTVQPTVPTTTSSPMPVGVKAGPGTTPIMAGQIMPTGGGTPGIQPTFTDMQYKGPALPNTPGDPLARGGQGGATAAPAGSMLTTNMSQIQPSGGAMPGPGTSPIGPGMNPTAPANPFMTGFGPGNDLRFQQINPTANDRLTGTQGAVDSAVAALQGGPNRQALAQSLFADYMAQSQPDFEASLRSITQRNAAGGRLGSGMYGTNLTDAATQRTRDLGSYATKLAYDTAGGDIQDRFNTVGTLAGLEGQQFGQGLTQRNELRGERGYQSDVAQQGQQDAINQRLLEEQLLNSQFGRDYQRYGLLGQLGYGSNPAGTLGGLAGDTQGAANQAGAGVNDLFTQWLLSQGG